MVKLFCWGRQGAPVRNGSWFCALFISGYAALKTCDGHESSPPTYDDATAYYTHLTQTFNDCDYVTGNIHINDKLSTLSKSEAPLSFLNKITEVRGYIRINGLPIDTTKLPFPLLTVVGGDQLTNTADKNYAIHIANLGYMTSLGLPSLRGRVRFRNTFSLCPKLPNILIWPLIKSASRKYLSKFISGLHNT